MASRTVASQDLGRAGEQAALTYLEAKGYTLVARNWRSGRLELDLIMERRGLLVFVEVKARGPGSRATPEEALDPRKRKALGQAVSQYLSQKDMWGRTCRMDLIAVRMDSALNAPELEHHQDVLDFGTVTAGGWQPW